MSKQQWLDNGDLNPDPFYLTLEEAKKLADYFGDEQLLTEIRDAVWEGETMVPIAQKYAELWEEFKKLKELD
jgi:hypothetical protein